MKYEYIPRCAGLFNQKKEFLADVNVPWHVHEEYELVYINTAMLHLHVGSSFQVMEEDCLLLIGPYLPHSWEGLIRSCPMGGGMLDSDYQICIHFNENAYGNSFFDIPVFSSIKNIIQRSEYGLIWKGSVVENIRLKLEAMFDMDDVAKSILFLSVLDELSRLHNYAQLSTFSYRETFREDKVNRMNLIFDYITENYREPIRICELANLANMNKNAFCFYFKQRTGKTPLAFINDVRIAHACKMLCNNDSEVIQVCYESGFNNLSNFNRIFKKTLGMTPLKYRTSLRNKILTK